MTWESRKQKRIDHYRQNIHGWKLRPCSACNGSGFYDHVGASPCGACEGTGKERFKGPKADKKGKIFKCP